LLAKGTDGHGAEGVAVGEGVSACWANNLVFEVGAYIGVEHGRSSRFALLHRPLLDGAVDLPQVVDAGILLGVGAGAEEIRNRNNSEQAKESDYDDYFNERKSRKTEFLALDRRSTLPALTSQPNTATGCRSDMRVHLGAVLRTAYKMPAKTEAAN
jgi:hypothetical protein